MATHSDRDDDWMDGWSRPSDAEIAAAWSRYQAEDRSRPSEDDDHWWAVDALMNLQSDDPIRALEIAFLIARASGDPKVLAMLGALPLEDLLSEDPTLLDAISIEARSSPNLRVALESVAQSAVAGDVWAAIQRLGR